MAFSPSFSSVARLTALSGALLLGTLSAPDARADSIGINFTGNNAVNTLSATTSAGAVAQTNWNNLSGSSGTNVALNNSNGAATTTTLIYSATAGNSFGQVQPAAGDEQLNNGGIANTRNNAITFTLNNISYGSYDIYVYNLAYGGTDQQTTLGSASFYSTSPNPNDASHVDGDGGTAYIYTQATSNTPGTAFTPNADYVRFASLTGASQSFSVTGLNNFGIVSGIQVVATPEPSTYAMMFLGIGALGLVTWKRKRSANSEAGFTAAAI